MIAQITINLTAPNSQTKNQVIILDGCNNILYTTSITGSGVIKPFVCLRNYYLVYTLSTYNGVTTTTTNTIYNNCCSPCLYLNIIVKNQNVLQNFVLTDATYGLPVPNATITLTSV